MRELFELMKEMQRWDNPLLSRPFLKPFTPDAEGLSSCNITRINQKNMVIVPQPHWLNKNIHILLINLRWKAWSNSRICFKLPREKDRKINRISFEQVRTVQQHSRKGSNISVDRYFKNVTLALCSLEKKFIIADTMHHDHKGITKETSTMQQWNPGIKFEKSIKSKVKNPLNWLAKSILKS